jgi:catechol 2,3-dioxygenase-like lactoylglutathione lyase family enzyme
MLKDATIHVYLPASNVARARKFYEDVIGLMPRTANPRTREPANLGPLPPAPASQCAQFLIGPWSRAIRGLLSNGLHDRWIDRRT